MWISQSKPRCCRHHSAHTWNTLSSTHSVEFRRILRVDDINKLIHWGLRRETAISTLCFGNNIGSPPYISYVTPSFQMLADLWCLDLDFMDADAEPFLGSCNMRAWDAVATYLCRCGVWWSKRSSEVSPSLRLWTPLAIATLRATGIVLTRKNRALLLSPTESRVSYAADDGCGEAFLRFDDWDLRFCPLASLARGA